MQQHKTAGSEVLLSGADASLPLRSYNFARTCILGVVYWRAMIMRISASLSSMTSPLTSKVTE